MIRRKRKPDSIKLNFVESVPGNKRSIKIKPVSYPFAPMPALRVSSDPAPAADENPAESVLECPLINEAVDLESSNPPSSSHTKRKEKSAEAWEEVRPNIAPAMVSSVGFPNGVVCVFCLSCPACVWCPDCGFNGYLCENCTVKLHERINLFHSPLVWKECDHIYIPFRREISIRSTCECSARYTRVLTCVNTDGSFHSVSIEFCTCESEVETLLHARLFPATPKHPQLAFTFELMDWLEALMLECHVSAHDFVAAIEFLSSSKMLQAKQCHLYPVIIDSFEEYRYQKNELRHLKFLLPSRHNDGTKCPACPQDGAVYYSIDGNFGLCRKRSSGNSVRLPLHGQTMFFCQDDVNAYVSNYGSIRMSTSKECNQFLAGDALRSRSRYKGLDETGVIGIVCRHECPFKLLSMHHGERFSYIVYVLEKLLECCQQHRNVYILYDVACTLLKHLQNQGRSDLIGFFDFAIPVFHSYGHKVECQFKYSPRNKDGLGLTDGEVVERFWAYLRRFSRMTKEMRPSHRVDVLTDAALHYSRKSAQRLTSLLPSRMKKAVKIRQESKEALEKLMTSSSVRFTTTEVEQWYHLEIQERHTSAEIEEVMWERDYFTLLETYYNLRGCIGSCSSSHLQTLLQKLQKIDAELRQHELKHGFTRWEVDSDTYCDMKRDAREQEGGKVLDEIASCARERWFLLKLKAKFADGQYLASRLSKSITHQSSLLKKLVGRYNSLSSQQLSWEDATDLSSEKWLGGVLLANPCIPKKIKLDAIKYHHLVLRADEEVRQIQDEMTATVSFYLKDWRILLDAIKDRMSLPYTHFNNGALYCLQLARLKCEGTLRSLLSSFSHYVDLDSVPAEEFLMHNILHPSSYEASQFRQDVTEDDDLCPIERDEDCGNIHHLEEEESSDLFVEEEEGSDLFVEEEEGSDLFVEEEEGSDLYETDEDRDSGHVGKGDDEDSCGEEELDGTVQSSLQPVQSTSESMSLATSQPKRLINVQQSFQVPSEAASHLKVPPPPRGLVLPRRTRGSAELKKGDLKCVHSSHAAVPPTTLPSESSESDHSGDESGLFPSEEQMRRTHMRFEREDFLKDFHQQNPEPMFDQEDIDVLAQIRQGVPTDRNTRKGFLHMKKEDLRKAVKSAKLSLPCGPYFIKHKH